MRKLFRAAAPTVLLCTLPVNAQQQPSAGHVALAVAPSHEQLGLEDDLGIEPAAPVQPQIAPKNDGLFWVLPNYRTVENRDQSRRLSAKTNFELSAKTMSDPVTISFIGAMALIGQAQNSDPPYGQRLEGYAKRFGTFHADTGIGTLMTTSVFPTLLHQDPRCFQLGKGGAWHRVVYSVSQIFVTLG